jgi:hypothetical protein
MRFALFQRSAYWPIVAVAKKLTIVLLAPGVSCIDSAKP